MPLDSQSLKIQIIPSSTSSNLMKCVVGHQTKFKVKFTNISTTDPIYNIGLSLNLSNGISFVNSSIIESNNIINSSNNNIVTFVNLFDLFPNSQPKEIEITLTINPYYRGTNLPVQYGSNLSISLSSTGDSKPRGDYDTGNISVSTNSTSSVSCLRFATYTTTPSKQLKGAGTSTSSALDATSIYTTSIELRNSTRDSSNISLVINLANGLRYIQGWSSSGTNASNFTNPTISNISATQNHMKFTLRNKTLSPGSITTINFKSAIWNNYTANGLENSGNLIEDKSILSNSILLTGHNSTFEESVDIIASYFLINLSCDTEFTDALTYNEYNLSYSTTQYLTMTNVNLTLIISDGINYVNDSSTKTPTSIFSENNTTLLVWNFDQLHPASQETFTLSTLTASNYSNDQPIYSTDEFTEHLTGKYTPEGSLTSTTLSSSLTLISHPPIITTEILGYFYNNLEAKTFNAAAVQDYVKIGLTYDASDVSALQRNVSLFDYPPLIMDTDGVINIQVSSGFPAGSTYYPIPDNGAKIPLGDLTGGTSFSITFYLPVTEGMKDSIIYNLAKCTLFNSKNNSYTTRDSASVNFGIPHLSILSNITQALNCISLNNTFNYEITVSNRANDASDYIVDSFNIDFLSVIPSLFQITGTPTITSSSENTGITLVNNTLTSTITKISPNDSFKVSIPVYIPSPPLMGKAYPLYCSITNGTSQHAITSYNYIYNELPLDHTLNLEGCSPTIKKIYTPSTVRLFDTYKTKIKVDFPKGCLAYNTKIKDSLVSTNSDNLSNILLNGNPTEVALATNNIILPLNETLDTSDGPVTYIFEYEDKITSATTVNYEQNKQTKAYIDWSDEPSLPENYSIPYPANLKIVVPKVNTTLYQNNETLNYVYDKTPINGSINNFINYKLTLTNIGKSPGYQLKITDTIPHFLTYISNNVNGDYNANSKVFTANIDMIDINQSIDVILQCRVNNDNYLSIAKNISSATYKPNDIKENYNYSSTSNETTLYSLDRLKMIARSHRNVSNEENFSTSTIRCFNGQSIQYKGTVTNLQNETLTNVSIVDTFPSEFVFTSNEPFSQGVISVNNNIVSIAIPSLPPSTTLEYLYTVTLQSSALALRPSSAKMSYTYPLAANTFTIDSNTIYVKLLDLGKGFLVY